MNNPESVPITEEDFAIAHSVGRILQNASALSPRIPRKTHEKPPAPTVPEHTLILGKTAKFLGRLDGELGNTIVGVEF